MVKARMAILRRRGFRVTVALIALGWVLFHVGRLQTAEAVDAFIGADGLWNGTKGIFLLIHYVSLAALSAYLLSNAWISIRDVLRQVRFVHEADRASSSGQPYAVATVAATGFARLSRKRSSGALNSLRLYLDGFAEPGERCARLSRYSFALLLRCEDRSAFEKRLAILEQDTGFLFMASHPGKCLGARVSACRMDEAGGAAKALRRALSASHGAPRMNDTGVDKKSA